MMRQTISTSGPAIGTIDPSKSASAFSQSFDIKRETVSTDNSGHTGASERGEYDVLPVTKVEIVPSDSTSNPKHVYVNVSAQNDHTDIGVPAQFQIDFDQPYLKNTEKYYLTIAKAIFPTTSIPFFEFIQGKYQISITLPSAAYSITIPIIPLNTPATTDGLFFVYYYQQFLDSINQAILTAFLQMKARTSFGGNASPFIIFDKPSTRFALIAEKGFWYPDDGDGAILSIDYSSYRLFNGLPSQAAPGQPGGETSFVIEGTGQEISDSQAPNPSMQGNMFKNIEQYWNVAHTYSQGMVVLFDTIYYGCIANGTVGPQPDVSPASWQPQGTSNPNIWSNAITYVESQIVYYPAVNGVPFVSLQYPNLNQTPTPAAATAFWLPLTSGNPSVWLPGTTYAAKQNVYYPNISSGNIYTSIANGNLANLPTDDTKWTSASVFSSHKIISEYSSLSNWSDIESIVIQTGTLPVRYEVFAPPQSDNTSSGSQVPRPVLTDLDPIKSSEGFDRTPLQYVPPGPYRMIDLLAREELKRIDVYVQYKHKDLSFTDLIMLPGDYFAIKFLFIRNDALTVT